MIIIIESKKIVTTIDIYILKALNKSYIDGVNDVIALFRP